MVTTLSSHSLGRTRKMTNKRNNTTRYNSDVSDMAFGADNSSESMPENMYSQKLASHNMTNPSNGHFIPYAQLPDMLMYLSDDHSFQAKSRQWIQILHLQKAMQLHSKNKKLIRQSIWKSVKSLRKIFVT